MPFLRQVANSINTDLFDLVVCPQCKIVWVNPRPDEKQLLGFYPQTYWAEEGAGAEATPQGLAEKFQGIFIKKRLGMMLKPVKRFVPKRGKLLDVGCGTGEITKSLKNMGYDASGIDFSPNAVEYARKVHNVHVDYGDFLEFPYQASTFDAVTLFGVLEHMPVPYKVLQRCFELLKPRGILIIKVPNISCLQFALFKKRWSGLMPPVHLYQFSPNSLSLMLKKTGFVPRQFDHYSLRESPGLLIRSLAPQLHPSQLKRYNASTGKGFLLRVIYLIGQMVSLPIVYLESMLNKGAMVTVYSEKNA